MNDDKLEARREKKRAYNAAYRVAHREELREKNRSYYVAHREERRAYDAARYATNCEEMLERQRAYKMAHHEELLAYAAAYKADHKEERRKRQTGFRRWITLLKATQGCTDCGTHEGWLEYHHVDPDTKLYDLAHMWESSDEAFLDELAKCTVLCCSCHMRRHVVLGGAV